MTSRTIGVKCLASETSDLSQDYYTGTLPTELPYPPPPIIKRCVCASKNEVLSQNQNFLIFQLLQRGEAASRLTSISSCVLCIPIGYSAVLSHLNLALIWIQLAPNRLHIQVTMGLKLQLGSIRHTLSGENVIDMMLSLIYWVLTDIK